jgi:hypothetical protein
MKATIGFSLCLLGASVAHAATEKWVLQSASVTYTVHHPLKTASGTSKDAKGKGLCEKGQCQFLIAAPLKSFDSGDSNRDLHMLEVTRGGANPMVLVRTSAAEGSFNQKRVPLTFEIEFAGKKATYRNITFDVLDKDKASAHTKGTIEIKLTDFNINPPSLLT